MNESHDQTLSPAGAARRDRMLGELKNEMRRTHASRRTRKVLALNAVVLTGIVGVVAMLNRPSSPTTPAGSGEIARSNPQGERPQVPAPAFVITRESTPINLLEKYAVRTPSTTAETLTDAQLLAALASIDRPAGLVRTGDRVWLTREVADAPRAGVDSNSS